MHATKLISQLQAFDKKQLKRFHKFLQSPYFNENALVIQFYEQLIKFHPLFESKQITKANLFKKLFGKTTIYDDAKLRRLSSNLFKLTESFISHELLQADPFKKTEYLLDFYTHHKIVKHFNSNLKLLFQEQQKTNYQDANYFYKQYVVSQYQRLAFVLNEEDTRSTAFNENLQDYVNSLETFYFIDKLSMACSILNHSKVVQFEYDLGLIDAIIQQIQESRYEHIPLVRMYGYAFQMIRDSSEPKHFHLLKTSLELETEMISNEDLLALFIFARNYCIAQINNGQDTYLQEILDLFKLELNNLIEARQIKLSRGNFKNMVTIALRLGDYDWVEQFIDDYIQHLPIETQKDVMHYSKGHLFFYQKKYDEAIQMLYQTTFKDVFYKIGSRKILLQIYHELDELDARDNLLNSLRVFIHSKKNLISHNYIESMRNFLNALTAITKLLPNDTNKIEQLKAELKTTKVVTEKKWLLEQLNNL